MSPNDQIKMFYRDQEREIKEIEDVVREKISKLTDQIYELQHKEGNINSAKDSEIERIKAKYETKREPAKQMLRDAKARDTFEEIHNSKTIEWSTAQVHNNYFQGTSAPPPVKLLESYNDGLMVLGLYYTETNRPTNKAVLVIQGFCKLYTEDRDLGNSGLVYSSEMEYTHKPLNDLLWTDEKTHPKFFENRESKIEMGNYGNVGKEIKFFKTKEQAIAYSEKLGIKATAKVFFEKYDKARETFNRMYDVPTAKIKRFYKVPTKQTVKNTEEITA